MPLYTSARIYTRYSNARTRGFNGFATSSESVPVTEASGMLVGQEQNIPVSTQFTSVPFPERLSASARYGDRITFSYTIIGTAGSFEIDTAQNLGAVVINCGNEFNWNISLSYDGPACGKIRVNGISGSVTLYNTANPTLPYYDGPPLGFAVSEEGTDYSETEGQRSFKTWEIMGANGIPWSQWIDIG